MNSDIVHLAAPVASLVLAALARFGVRPQRLQLLASEVVRVDTDDGQRVALRFRPHSGRAFGNIPLELAWTAALHRDTDIRPPEPVPGVDGALAQEVAVPELPEPYDCVLFRWVAGTELANRLTPENVHKLGVLSARLHEHAAMFRPPAAMPVRTLDRLTRGGEREVIFSYEHPTFLPAPRRASFMNVAEHFHRTVDALYADPTGLRVIHADLHHENVKVHRGTLYPLDFYEVIWGYPIQDIALTFYDLRFYADSRPYGYAALRDAFAQGYASRLPWPEAHAGQIDTLIAGRRLRQANWVLEHETAQFAASPDKVPNPSVIVPYFERVEAEFRVLLETWSG